MSVIIKGCAEGLVEKFQKIAENEGKLNAKKYPTLQQCIGLLFSIFNVCFFFVADSLTPFLWT